MWRRFGAAALVGAARLVGTAGLAGAAGLVGAAGLAGGARAAEPSAAAIAAEIRADTGRTWAAYTRCAWGHDELRPLTCGAHDWYGAPLGIAPVDGYSTLKLMGFDAEAARIHRFVLDDARFDRDADVKTYEMYQRILGGLLATYADTHDPRVLAKAEDFARRLLPAFASPTGIPYYYVNLKTGAVKGATVNVAEAASYVFEFGILSYYTKNPVFYQAGMKAERAIFSRRSAIGLVGESIDVETGKWLTPQSHVGAYIDSYYEYMFKASLLFGDPELNAMWRASIAAVQAHIADEHEGELWFAQVDKDTGARLNRTTNVWDAYFPGLLALSGDVARAARHQDAWDRVWRRWRMLPERFDYGTGAIEHGAYTLNPEMMESVYYLSHATHDPKWRARALGYYRDLERCCRTANGYATIKDVRTGEKTDLMETFFIAETLKYLWLTFTPERRFKADDYVFTTEAQPFRRADFDRAEARMRLGFR